MQEDYYSGYREYLREGMRIEVGIPLSGGGVFRDWATVGESGGDQLLVQISRDVLPTEVRIEEGAILDVSIWIRKEVYTCSGIVIEKSGGRVLRIRLFGPFTLRERRQFFRISLNLRIRYAPVRDASWDEVEADWAQRRDLEHLKYQGYDEAALEAQRGRYRPVRQLEWRELPWAELNLCGGGTCIALPEPVQPEQLVDLEIHLPMVPPRQVQAVAQVIHVLNPREQRGGGFLFPAGMQFVHLDERDRDLVFRHISVTQIEHLRVLADRRPRVEAQVHQGERARWRQVMARTVWALIGLLVAYLVVRYLVYYRESAPTNQIQKTYERAIRQYRHQPP